MNNNKKDSKSKNIVRKVVRGTALSLCLYISLSASTNGIAQDDKYVLMKNIDENPKYILEQVEDSTGIETENQNNLVLLHAIINNNKLTEEEKSYFYELVDIIAENPYIDKQKTYESLQDLDIVYMKRPKEYDETVLAIYSETDNTIKVFEKRNDFNKEIFYHELIHALYTNSKTIKLPKFIIEGETELLTNEYLSESPFIERTTYPYEVSMIKLLCEMVGEEEVLKAYTTGDLFSLYNKLNYDANEFKGLKFISNLNSVFEAFQEGKTIPATEYNEAIMFMDDFFSTKYKNNPQKYEIYNYYKGILYLLNEENPYEKYDNYIEENGIILKAYYSNNLKEKYPTMKKAYIEKRYQKSLVK